MLLAPLAKPIESNPLDWCVHYRVSQFLLNGQWKFDSLNRRLLSHLSNYIKQTIPSVDPDARDHPVWHINKSKKFTITSTYSLVSLETPKTKLAKLIWALKVPSKMKFSIYGD